MIISKIFSQRVQDFIRSVENEDPKSIVLKKKTIDDIPPAFIADQVSGRKKAKEKIPEYYNNPTVVFPPQVNLEQSSSQATSQFKAKFIEQQITKCETCADLTGGFGIDSYYLSRVFEKVICVEAAENIFDIARYNHEQLGARNIHHINQTAEDFLKASAKQFDLIFIDPSRRKAANQKVYSLSQSEPDVVELQHTILGKATWAMVKASPLLDLHLGLTELKHVKKAIVLSVDNECKELLFFQETGFSDEPDILAVNIQNGQSDYFEFKPSSEKLTTNIFSQPKKYLYEPNSSILKAGAFKIIGERFRIEKLHPNTHLYTSDLLIENFPGRTFAIEQHVKSDARLVIKFLPDQKANVVARNYPLKADELKKKLKLKDGGPKYLIGFTGSDKKYLVVADRIR